MTIHYTIKPELGAVVIEADDTLNFSQILDYYKRLSADPEFKPEYHRIFDYSNVIEIDLSAEELKKIAAQAEIGDENKGKTIIIPGDSFSSSAIGRLYAELANYHRGRDHLIFESVEEALNWAKDQT